MRIDERPTCADCDEYADLCRCPAMKPPDSIAARLRELAHEFYETCRETHTEGVSTWRDEEHGRFCPERCYNRTLLALAVEVEAASAKVRAGFWSTDERIAVADALAARPEEKP